MRATSIPASAVPEFPELPTDSLLEAYGRMTLIRVFEERVSELYRNSEVPGFVHLSIGQEAAAVGACWPLAVTDVITSNHRGHGHCLAKGLAPEPMMAELLARATGTNKGLGGSMHIADPDLGIFGANGIVAAGVPIAGGAALAAKLRGQARRGGVVLRRRRGRAGRLPRGGQPGRAVAAADRVLLREQRLRGVLADRRPAPGADGRPRGRVRPRLRAGRRQRRGGGRRGHDRRGAAHPRGRRPGVRGGRHLPLARPLRGRPGEVPQRRRAVGVAAARPAGHHPRAAARPRRRAGRPSTRSRRRCGPGSTPPSTPPGRRRRRT